MPTKETTKARIVRTRSVYSMLGQAGQHDTASYFRVPLRDSRTGVSNPNWKTLIKSGQSASTPLSGTSQDFNLQDPAYSAHWLWPAFGPSEPPLVGNLAKVGLLADRGLEIPFTAHPDTFPSNPDLVEEAYAKAVKALYKKIRGAHSQFAGGVFLGELRKTVQMIARPAKALQDAVLAHKQKITKIVNGRNVSFKGKTKRVTSAEVRRVIAGTYLEATFGWQPLLSDVKDAAIALARLQADRQVERFRAFGQSEDILSRDDYHQTVFGLPYHYETTVRKQTAICVFKGAFQGVTNNELLGPSIERLIGLSGFQFRDFVPTVWELIPGSFLADYFSNIGDVLEAACTDTSAVRRLDQIDIEEYSIRTSVRVSHSEMAAKIVNQWPGSYAISQTGGVGWYELVLRTVRRTPTSVPFLLPRFERPDLFSRQSLNIAALLAGARPAKL